MSLEFVPEKFKTFELCSDAIKSNVMALEYIPSNLFYKYVEA
jgi:hypothetical protein